MRRLSQLHTNLGWTGVARIVVVGGLFLAIAVGFFADQGDPWPLAVGLVCAAIPVAARRLLIARLDLTMATLRAAGLVIMGTAILGTLLRHHLPDTAILLAISAAVGLYLSTWVVVFSDPSVTGPRP